MDIQKREKNVCCRLKQTDKFGFIGMFYYNGCLKLTPHQSLRDSFPSRGSLGLARFLSLPLEGKVPRNEADEVVTNRQTNPNLFIK